MLVKGKNLNNMKKIIWYHEIKENNVYDYFDPKKCFRKWPAKVFICLSFFCCIE